VESEGNKGSIKLVESVRLKVLVGFLPRCACTDVKDRVTTETTLQVHAGTCLVMKGHQARPLIRLLQVFECVEQNCAVTLGKAHSIGADNSSSAQYLERRAREVMTL
jgi:hypothetical protein